MSKSERIIIKQKLGGTPSSQSLCVSSRPSFVLIYFGVIKY